MTALYVGLMSGTSMDGIDAVLVDFQTDKPHLLATLSCPFSNDLQQQLLNTRRLSDEEVLHLDALDNELGRAFAAAVKTLLKLEGMDHDEIIAIGSHGQTIRHRPHADPPFSLQLGDAGTLCRLTGITTVSDFRTADIEAGGEGAPLAPAFHAAVLSSSRETRCVINIGGIANLTLLPADNRTDVSGYDTGPGNTLMDAWVRKHLQQSYDDAGSWGRTGSIHDDLLHALLSDDYFRQPPPKSTGFEYFNLDWLQSVFAQLPAEPAAEDVQATLCELTAVSIADAVKTCDMDAERVLLCGGGVHNEYLVERIRTRLAPCPVVSTEAYGIHPDWVEAMAFAWLARHHIEGKPGNLPAVTGAREAVVLGRITLKNH